MVLSWLGATAAAEHYGSHMCSPAPMEMSSEPHLLIRRALRLSNVTYEEFHEKYSRSLVQQPIVIENSNLDWFNESDWTRDAFLNECGDNPLVNHDYDDCAQDGHDKFHCHQVRYVEPDFVGHAWAAVEVADLAVHNLTTVRDLMESRRKAFTST